MKGQREKSPGKGRDGHSFMRSQDVHRPQKERLPNESLREKEEVALYSGLRAGEEGGSNTEESLSILPLSPFAAFRSARARRP